MSLIWYPNSDSYDNSLIITCGCDENLKLNGSQLLRLDGLNDLVKVGLPKTFNSHMCIAAADSRKNDKAADKETEEQQVPD